ncbi:polysaccharide deacetylase family protein (plasmid) [Kitasatospora sp. NBC_00070]|uniref:polysaccharide deacetylase family protein n=1 Tax=Kitasatospora sp. NBC_00070 TaxID=2975962 RepID=UPI002F90D0CE
MKANGTVPARPALRRCEVTTSWDDGHRLDRRLAALLERYSIAGTFYIAPRNVEIRPAERLPPEGIRELADRNFEIGAHTLTHQRLPMLPSRQAAVEIRTGKEELEGITGSAVTSFCYPCGAYTATHVRQVREIGFRLARTVMRNSLRPGPPLELLTTVNAYAHRVDGPLALRRSGLRLRTAARLYLNWDDLAIHWFEQCLGRGGVFHLWGHSWEIEARGDWRRLERVLAHIGNRRDVRYVTNRELTEPVVP